MAESFTYDCTCPPQGRGTVPPSLLPYVYSVNDLQGQITLGNTGAIVWTSVGNTLFASLSASAGLGTVTSVAIASDSSNLSVVSGSPITTLGTITLDLAGNVGSIADLVMAADQTIYSTGPGVFVATSLSANGRTVIGHTFAQMRTDLGLVIGTNVQAWSADLDSFVTAASWSGGDDLFLTGNLTIAGNFVGGGTGDFAGAVTITGLLSGAAGGSFSGNVDAGSFSGNGASLTALNASNVSTGTLAVARGGTNIASYAVGDLLYAGATTTLSKLTSVAAGSYLRSGGLVTAPVWSTLVLPNAATVGDIFSSSTTNTMSRITAVATGNALISGGVATLPTWGKITSTHTDGSTIATISGGSNGDITNFSQAISFDEIPSFTQGIQVFGTLLDASTSGGNSGDILKSTGSGTDWTNQIAVSTIQVDSIMSIEGTLTAGGVTGNQTINKAFGTVRVPAAGTSVIVTNSLCTTSCRVLATVTTNDATAYVRNVVTTTGSFTITLGSAATGETEIAWWLVPVV